MTNDHWQQEMLKSLKAQADSPTQVRMPRVPLDAPGHTPAEEVADQTILRPAPASPRPLPSPPTDTAPVLPERTLQPASVATPTRAPRQAPVVAQVPSAAAQHRVPSPSPAQTANSYPSVTSAPDPELGQKLATLGKVRGEGVPVRALRATARLFGRDAFPERFAGAAQQLQGGVTTGRRIAVLSADGGVGRTTLTASIALLLASLRRDVTAAIHLGAAAGDLGLRLGEQNVVPSWQVARAAAGGELVDATGFHLQFTRVAPSLLCAGSTVADRMPAPDQLQALARGLSASVAHTLFDCPAGLDDRAVRQVVSDSHALLVVGRPTTIGVEHARQLLAQVAGAHPVVVALVDTDRSGTGRASHARRILERPGVTVHHVQWDRHLAAAGHIHLDHLAQAHRLDLATLAADLLGQARGGR